MTAGAPFPVTVAPQPREFLPGLLAKGDDDNGLPLGTSASMAGRHDTGGREYGRAPLFVLATTIDLARVAALFDTTVEAVTATTYREELLRLFGPGVSAMRLGVANQLRVCPACVRGSRLIKREFVLPLVHGCTEHGIWLRHRCVCGAPIEVFGPARAAACSACGRERAACGCESFGEAARRVRAFACAGCGRGWGELPRQPLGDRDWLRQRRVVHAYEVILGSARPGVVEAARRLLALDEGGRWDHGFCLADDPAIAAAAIPARHVKSVASIVANLVMRDIPPERLLEQAAVGPHPDLACRNRACPTYGTSLAIRVSAHRRAGVESYCAECGSRFLGSRTILSFDPDNGAPDLSPITVERALARLAEYAMRLAEAAYFFSRYRPSALVDEVFHAAGVPQSSHLRAHRLGLVALVARRLGVRIRGTGYRRGRLVEDGFADRWSFPHARIGWTGVYAGEDNE